MNALKKYTELRIAVNRLKLARTLLNGSLAAIIGPAPDYSNEYLQIQAAFDRWIDKANRDLKTLERQILESDKNVPS